MKLKYRDLLSPKPLYLSNVGGIKSPLLSEIDDIKEKYDIFVSFLAMTPDTYCRKIYPKLTEWYDNLELEIRNEMNMVDLIKESQELQQLYVDIFSFFIVEENIFWDDKNSAFFITKGNIKYNLEEQYFYTENEQGEIAKTMDFGFIIKENFNEICDVILQRCGIDNHREEEKPKFKNKAAERIWLKTQKAREANQHKIDEKMERGNIISAYASHNHNSINILNIWNMTIFQLYDQFQREQIDNYYDIVKTQVGQWGDKDSKFDATQWYELMHKN